MATEPNQPGNLTQNGSGDNTRINGGVSIRGNVTNQGGVNLFSSQAESITYTDNRGLSLADESHLKVLFASLHKQIDTAENATPEAKAEAKRAAQALQEEVDAVKQDPNHKPDRWKMNGLIAAFKNVGAPVLSVVLSILGFPPLGAAINAFASALPDRKES